VTDAAQDHTRELEQTQAALLNILDDLRSVEKLHELDQLKQRFIALASHELRTPLTSIAGFSSTLVTMWDTLDDDRKREFATIIDDQAQRTVRLISDVLVLSRINAGALDVQRRHANLREELERAAAEFPELGVTITCAPELRFHADPDHVHQALTNYLANAQRHGLPPFEIRATAAGDWVDVLVVDHGAGIAEELLPHLFEEFAPSAPARDDDAPRGSGLGLSIVRRLIRAQGGDAWYEPNYPDGSRFGLRLPQDGEDDEN
jgi:two-component system sensor histidine kinase MtrB